MLWLQGFLVLLVKSIIYDIVKWAAPPLVKKVMPKDLTEDQKQAVREGRNPFRMPHQREK